MLGLLTYLICLVALEGQGYLSTTVSDAVPREVHSYLVRGKDYLDVSFGVGCYDSYLSRSVGQHGFSFVDVCYGIVFSTKKRHWQGCEGITRLIVHTSTLDRDLFSGRDQNSYERKKKRFG